MKKINSGVMSSQPIDKNYYLKIVVLGVIKPTN